MQLPTSVGSTLTSAEDDVICILALHAHSIGLLPGLRLDRIERRLAQESPDGEHWLSLYEAVRQGFLPDLWPVVAGNEFLSDLLMQEVTFYRTGLKPYSMILHSGGAPNWVAQKWIRDLKANPVGLLQAFPGNAFMAVLGADLGNLAYEDKNELEIIMQLLGEDHPEGPTEPELYA